MKILIIILVLLTVLLNLKASACVSYIDGVFGYKIRYTFIPILTGGDEKEEKKKKKKEKKTKEKSSEETSDSKKETDESSSEEQPKRKRLLGDKIIALSEKISSYVRFADDCKGPLKRLLKGICFTDIDFDFQTANEDAYVCAMEYGTVCAGMYNILGFLSGAFKTKIRRAAVEAKYNSNDSRYNISFSVKAKVITLITVGIGALRAYLRKDKSSKEKNEKQSNNQTSEKEESIDMSEHPVNSLLGTTIEKIRNMIDVNTIIGEPITTKDGTTIIPVSKMAIGFASGGSDIPSKQPKNFFGGGAGAGVSVQPIAFLCVNPDGEVKLLQISVNASKEAAIITTIPELIDKIANMVSGKNKDKSSNSSKTKKREEKPFDKDVSDDIVDITETDL